ncbi:hypothetical protein HD554DRAFT_2038927 [Boletus coccyginus]|nr:hypothetical protein HD554DRAFT_2038927 [Boletus coccyginus]
MATLQVVMVNLVVYAIACETQGIKYITIVKQAPQMSQIRSSISGTSKATSDLHQLKLSANQESNLDDQKVQMDENWNKGPSDKNDWGAVKKNIAAVKCSHNDVTAAMKHIELGNRLALKEQPILPNTPNKKVVQRNSMKYTQNIVKCGSHIQGENVHAQIEYKEDHVPSWLIIHLWTSGMLLPHVPQDRGRPLKHRISFTILTSSCKMEQGKIQSKGMVESHLLTTRLLKMTINLAITKLQ